MANPEIRTKAKYCIYFCNTFYVLLVLTFIFLLWAGHDGKFNRDKLHLTPYNPKLPTIYTAESGYVRKEAMTNFLAEKFQGKENGFFVEYRAFDGVSLSNTINLEKTYNWSGLLIEPDEDAFSVLMTRNRRAWITDLCLSPILFPTTMNMTRSPVLKRMRQLGKTASKRDSSDSTKPATMEEFEVDCYPLANILSVIGQKQVEYLSLNIEQNSINILKTFPWLDFEVKLVSTQVSGKSREEIRSFMESVGYRRTRWYYEFKVIGDKLYEDVYEREETETALYLRRKNTLVYCTPFFCLY